MFSRIYVMLNGFINLCVIFQGVFLAILPQQDNNDSQKSNYIWQKGLCPVLLFQNLCYGRLDDFTSLLESLVQRQWNIRYPKQVDLQSKCFCVASFCTLSTLFYIIVDLLFLMGPGDKSDRKVLTFEGQIVWGSFPLLEKITDSGIWMLATIKDETDPERDLVFLYLMRRLSISFVHILMSRA